MEPALPPSSGGGLSVPGGASGGDEVALEVGDGTPLDVDRLDGSIEARTAIQLA